MTSRFLQRTLIATATLWLAACATPNPPTDQIAVSTAAVASATTAGGATWAPAEMTTARDKLRQAREAMDSKDYDRARTLAQQSQADAQLAEAKVRAGKAAKAADEVRDANRALQVEMNRKTQ